MNKKKVLYWIFRGSGYLCVIVMLFQMFSMKGMEESKLIIDVAFKVVPLVLGFYLFQHLAKKYAKPT